jgi:hypothetical protein
MIRIKPRKKNLERKGDTKPRYHASIVPDPTYDLTVFDAASQVTGFLRK